MAATETNVVRVNDANLYYEVHGAGKPLLLIQGCGGEISSWQAIVPALSQNFQTIIFDNRGMGRSEVTPGDYTTELLASDATGLLNHLQIPQTHVLGWSMGGMIAQEIALMRPEITDKLVLSATAAKFSAKSGFIFQSFLQAAQQKEFATQTNWSLELCFSERFFSNHEAVAATQKAFASSPYPPTLEGLTGQVAALTAHDRRGQLKEISVPTLVIGAVEDGFFTVRQLEELALEITGAELQILPGAHMYHVENAANFCETVIEFLAR